MVFLEGNHSEPEIVVENFAEHPTRGAKLQKRDFSLKKVPLFYLEKFSLPFLISPVSYFPVVNAPHYSFTMQTVNSPFPLLVGSKFHPQADHCIVAL